MDNSISNYNASNISCSEQSEMAIYMCKKDVSLAYWIKKTLGWGRVKNKDMVVYYSGPIGYKVISRLTDNKRLMDNMLNPFPKKFNTCLYPVNMDHPWLAGFTVNSGCFNIRVVKSKSYEKGYGVVLEYTLKHKYREVLIYFKEELSRGYGHVWWDRNNNIWCYRSQSLKLAGFLILYFDHYKLSSSKFIQYVKYRKVYLRILKNRHLSLKDLKKIKNIATKGSSETSTQKST